MSYSSIRAWPHSSMEEQSVAADLASFLEDFSLRNYNMDLAHNHFELAEACFELFDNFVRFAEIPFGPIYETNVQRMGKQFTYGFGGSDRKEYPAGYQKIGIKSGDLMRSIKEIPYDFTEEGQLGDKRLDLVADMPTYGEAIQHGMHGMQSVRSYVRGDGASVEAHSRKVNMYPRPFFTLYQENLQFMSNVYLYGIAYAFNRLFKRGRTNFGKLDFWGS